MDVGFRYALRWAAARRRTWVAVGFAALATWLASQDHRAGWTIVVGVLSATFAVLAIWGSYADAHPHRKETVAARERARVEAIVARFEEGVRPMPNGEPELVPEIAPEPVAAAAVPEPEPRPELRPEPRPAPSPLVTRVYLDDDRLAELERRIDILARALSQPPPAVPVDDARLAALESRVDALARAFNALAAELGAPDLGERQA